MTERERQGIICRMAKKRQVEAKAVTDKDQLSEGTSSLISWIFRVLGWHPACVPTEWLERLPHPSFAAFVLKTMLGENSERWGFPPCPNISLNDESEFRGHEWEAPINRLHYLQTKLTTEPRHGVLKAFWSRWQCLRGVRNWQDSSELPDMDWPSIPLQIETGAATLNAFLGGDIEFFRDIVRMMELESGGKRTSNWIKGIQIIQIAFDLCTAETGNPSREQVQQTAEKSGVQVGDWPSMFDDCRLDFLKYETERRGRPKKQNKGRFLRCVKTGY